MVRSWPRRPNSGCWLTWTLTIRSPAGAPAWPGSPWPLSRTVAPSLTPTGTRTRSSRVRISLPRPLQVGQGSRAGAGAVAGVAGGRTAELQRDGGAAHGLLEAEGDLALHVAAAAGG